MTNITGVRTTANINQSRRVVDMSKNIALLEPNAGPLLTLLKLAKGRSKAAINPKFEWLEDDLLGSWNAVNNSSGYNTSATDIVVDDETIFRVGDVVKNVSTGEQLLVTVITAATHTLTVVRGYGTTAAAAITDDDPLLILGNASAENGISRTVKSTQVANQYNYTQIFRTPVAITGTENASHLYGGKDRAYQRKKAAIEHKRDIARAFYFGERKEDTTGATPRRTTAGVLYYLTTAGQVQAFSSGGTALSFKNFDQYVAQKAFRYGSTEKLMIAGPNLAVAVNEWARGDLQTKSDRSATYGINVTDLITSYGVLKVVYDPLLEGAKYGGYGIVLDTENIAYRYLEGRDTKLNVDIQNNDVDGFMDEYLTECGLELCLPKTHMLITGAYV